MKQSETNFEKLSLSRLFEYVDYRLQNIITARTVDSLSKIESAIYAPALHGYKSIKSPFEIDDFNGTSDLILKSFSLRSPVFHALVFFEDLLSELESNMAYRGAGIETYPEIEILKDYFKKRKEIDGYIRALYHISTYRKITDDLEMYIPKALIPRGLFSSDISQTIIEAPYENDLKEQMFKEADALVDTFKDEVYVWEVENLL